MFLMLTRLAYPADLQLTCAKGPMPHPVELYGMRIHFLTLNNHSRLKRIGHCNFEHAAFVYIAIVKNHSSRAACENKSRQ